MSQQTRTPVDLRTTPSYGPSVLCNERPCDLWVIDTGDRRCVLHSREPWAVTYRQWYGLPADPIVPRG